MSHNPTKLDQIIKMAKRCASPLPWETDITRANEKIFALWSALRDIRDMCIPGMNWTDEIGQELLNQADEAIAIAEEYKL